MAVMIKKSKKTYRIYNSETGNYILDTRITVSEKNQDEKEKSKSSKVKNSADNTKYGKIRGIQYAKGGLGDHVRYFEHVEDQDPLTRDLASVISCTT